MMQVTHYEIIIETRGDGHVVVVDCDNRPRKRRVVVSFIGTGRDG